MSLTTCLKKAGAAIDASDKAAVIARAKELRTGGASADDAARQAVDERLAEVRAMIEKLAGGAPAAPAAAPAAAAKPRALSELVQAHLDAEAELRRQMEARAPLASLVELTKSVTASRDALAAHLEAAADGLQAKTDAKDGRLLTLTPSAQKPGQWQITRFDDQGEPWGDSQYTTKAKALDDFIREADVSTLLVEAAPAPATAATLKLNKPAKPKTIKAEAGDSDAVRQAKADALKALGDLSDIIGKSGKAFMTPEQEQKLIPVLTRLMDAAFRLGYYKFKAAAKFALDQIREALGDATANDITLENLQGAYIGMSGRYRDQGADGIAQVGAVTTVDEINAYTEETDDVPGTDGDVERDRQDPEAGPPPVGGPVQDEADGAADGAAGGGARAGGQGGGRSGGSRVPAGGATPRREPRNKPVDRDAESGGPAIEPPGGDVDGAGAGAGSSGVPVDDRPAGEAPRATAGTIPEVERRRAQRQAEGTPIVLADAANIDATLPYLLPQQREDVLKAETRFALADGYGMLFTNGTGTGKTFTGLGVVKRHAMRGMTDTIIVVPSDKIADDWVTSGRAMGLTITLLENTRDAGRGIVVTTYANFGANTALVTRPWGLVVHDEAHYLSQNKDGTATGPLAQLRALTLHPDGQYSRFQMLHERDVDRQNVLITLQNKPGFTQAMADELEKLTAKLKAAREAVYADVAARQGLARPRALFLSATPFAYVPSIEWAQGYLFEYAEGYPYDETSRGYNTPNPREHFFVTHFGYRMRVGKLTQPDAKVDSGLMERQFNAWLKRRGSLSGRVLDVDADYDRRFILIESKIGNDIDAALDYLNEQSRNHPDTDVRGGFYMLSDLIRKQFDYLSRRYLLEAIKAKAAVPIIQEHLAKGRKVVLFHDYKKGGGFNPFDVQGAPGGLDPTQRKAFVSALAEFRAAHAPLIAEPLHELGSAIETLTEAFPDALLFNGDVSDKDRRANVRKFQDDSSGPQLIIVQSEAGKEGISLHDTTGRHQRVLLNLGQPTKPTTSIQQEGRIYRIGQVTDAIQRYMNTGTSWERWAFASTIAQRASTAENLGAGEAARALKDAFITAFMEASLWSPGHEGEGKGGKARDKAANDALTEYDRARAFYYGTQKKDQRTKAKEGLDYFATPEPVGLKMVEWLDLRPGEHSLEPSAGHGAIARWLPDSTNRTAIEPSTHLQSMLALVYSGDNARILAQTFESWHIVNKVDGVAMNPPFNREGSHGSALAFEHLEKASQHLREGGRIVALLPRGPAADKRFDAWLVGERERDVKPVAIVNLGAGLPDEGIYVGDSIKTNQSWMDGRVLGRSASGALRVKTASPGETLVPESTVRAIARTGPRKETYRPSEGFRLVANILMPTVTFERAGTAVPTRIVVIDRDMTDMGTVNLDLSGIDKIEDLFNRMEHLSLPRRAKPDAVEADDSTPVTAAAPPKVKADPNAQKGTFVRGDRPLVKHTTAKGKELTGIVVTGITLQQAKEIDKFTFAKAGGFFIRQQHLAPEGDGNVAQEERAVYNVHSPQANYDLFGNELESQAAALPARKARPRTQALDAVPAPQLPSTSGVALAVRRDPAMPGVYRISTQLVEVGRRGLPVASVKKWADAVAATAAMSRYSVEHFDLLITDKDGKPLAVVGAFKGALTQTSVYPATLLMEALRIEGAHRAWGVHNHPSGAAVLSRADEFLGGTLLKSFGPSSVEFMGVAVVATKDGQTFDWMAATNSGGHVTGQSVVGEPVTFVPIVDRTIIYKGDTIPPAIESPAVAKDHMRALLSQGPGLVILNAQHQPTAWVPVNPGEMLELRKSGRFDKLINSLAEGSAAAVMIANPRGALSERTVENIASALALVDVRVLDVIDAAGSTTTSQAERGNLPWSGQPVLSQAAPFYSELQRRVMAASMGAAPAKGWGDWLTGLKGVKPEEIEWSGVRDWLALQAGKVTKQAVLDYLEGNAVKVTETQLGGDEQARADFEQARDEQVRILEQLGYRIRWAENGEGIRVEGVEHWGSARTFDVGDWWEDAEATEALDRLDDILRERDEGEIRVNDERMLPKYSAYALPGGTNYREVLLTLPTVPRNDEPQPLGALPVGYEAIFDSQEPQGQQWGITEPGQMHARPWAGRHADPEAARAAALKKLNAERLAKWRDAAPEYKSGHWDQRNILAHIRMNDRTDADGRRVLFIEEIQSDWAQEGKKRGFASPEPADFSIEVRLVGSWHPQFPETRDKWRVTVNGQDRGYIQAADENEARYKANSNEQNRRDNSGKPPAAPFVGKTDAWVGLAVRRIIKMAVDGGYDRVAFVTGEQSVDRYSLRKQVDKIVVSPRSQGDTIKNVTLSLAGDHSATVIELGVDANAVITRTNYGDFVGKPLAEVVGREVAEQIMGSERATLEADDLALGGEGMTAFYDKIVPAVLKDVLRKVSGGQLGQVLVARPSAYPREFPSEAAATAWAEANLGDHDYTVRGHRESEGTFVVYDEYTNQLVMGLVGGQQPGFDITDAIRERAAGGLPLFRDEERAAAAPSERTSAIRQAVEQAAAEWAGSSGGPRSVTVANDFSGLPPAIQAQIRSMGAERTVRALLNPDGSVYLLANRFESAEQAQAALFHEVYGHFGLRAFLGDSYGETMAMLRVANPALAAKANEWFGLYGDKQIAARVKAGMSREEAGRVVRLLAVEEALADRAGTVPVPAGWQGVMAKLQAALRRMGLDAVANYLERLSQAETLALLVAARRAVREGLPHALGGDGMAALSRRFSSLPGQRPTASYVDATPRQQATLDEIDAGPESTDFELLPAKEDLGTSADAHFTDWELERGVKYPSLAMLGPFSGYDNAKDSARIRRLADSIKESNTFEPIFVGVDPNGEAYVMEGQHRARALQLLGHTHIPARIVVSMEGSADDYATQPEPAPSEPTDFKANKAQRTLFPKLSQAAPTDSPAFRAWFGDSKVVDAEGKPLVVHHATTYGDFDTFAKGEQRKGMAGYGFYFSDTLGANIYADYGANFQMQRSWKGEEKKVNVMPVYLAMQNPLKVDNIADVQARYGKRDPGGFGQAREFGGMAADALTAIQRDGYDGVITNEYVKRQRDGSHKVVEPGTKGAIKHPVYVVFEPTQIKSAIGNAGTFDPASPSILLSQTPPPPAPGAAAAPAAPRRSNVQTTISAGPAGQTVATVTINGVTQTATFPTQAAAQTWANGLTAGHVPAAPPTAWARAKARARAITSPEAVDTMIYKLQDRFVDLKRIQARVTRLGTVLAEQYDAYLGELMYHGRIAKRTTDFVEQEVTPLVQAMRDSKVTLDELEEYLHARHAPERNAAMAAINPDRATLDARRLAAKQALQQAEAALQTAQLAGTATAALKRAVTIAKQDVDALRFASPFKGSAAQRLSLSGMSDADAAAIIAALSPARKLELDALAARIDAMVAGTRQALIDYGLESRATMNLWAQKYPHYVPLHRDEAHETADVFAHPTGRGFAVRGPSSQRALGSNERVTDILTHLVMQREAALVRGEKNRVGQRLYTLAAAHPDPQTWRLVNRKMERVLNPKTGIVDTRVEPGWQQQPNVFSARFNGKDHFLEVNEDNPQAMRMVTALRNLDQEELHHAVGLLAKVTRYFAAINTQYNPIFGIVNFVRDAQGAAFNLTTTALAGRQAAVAAGIPSAIRAIYRQERGKQATNPVWAATWEEFQLTGAKTGFRDAFADVDDRRKEIERALNPTMLRGAARIPLDWLTHYNDAIENGVRLSAYKVAREQGMSREAAARLAKNLTVNFNKKGAATRELGAFYAFFNAAVQGTTRLYETLSGPQGGKIIIGGMLLGAIMQVVGVAIMGGDEYDKIPEFVRERAMVIPLGVGGDYVAVPMPLGLHVLPNIGRMAAELATDSTKTVAGQLGQLAILMAEAFNPIGTSSTLAQTVAPTVADPVVALLENRDWTGRRIYIENMSDMDPLPGHMRAKPAASLPAEVISRGVNDITGGAEFVPGAVSWTPDQLDYVFGVLTGGLGREVLKATQSATALAKGDELPPHRIPLAGRFYGTTVGASANSDGFYDALRDVYMAENQWLGLARSGRQEEARAWQAEHPYVGLAAEGRGTQRLVKNLREQRARVMEARADGFREEADQLQDEIAQAMGGFSRKVRELRAGEPAQ